jgi:hypothetical protein
MTITINGTGTITGITAGGLPDAIITQPELATGVAGTGPAFSAYAGSGTSLIGSTYTKILFDTEDFDTNNNFASSRFTPTVAGSYQINAAMQTSGSSIGSILIYKNGLLLKNGLYLGIALSSGVYVTASIAYLNGSTDYVEIYGYNGSATLNTVAGSANTYFNGAMVRSA